MSHIAAPPSPAAAGAPAAELDRYRDALAAAPALLFELSRGTAALRWVSPNVETLLGRAAPTVVGTRTQWERLVHPADRSAVREAVRAAAAGGRYEVDLRLRHAGGRWVWFRSTGAGADAGGADAGAGSDAMRGVALVHDEPRRVALRERTYRQLVHGVSRAVVRDEALVHVVEAARGLLDASRAKLYVADTAAGVLRNVAQSGAVAVPVLHIPIGDEDALIARCYRSGRAERVADYGRLATRLAARLRANATGPVLVTPVRVAGATVAVLVVTRERGRPPFVAADEEEAAHVAAQASFAIATARRDDPAAGDGPARSAFLSILGHELRTPLNTIEGFLELLALETPGPLTPRQRDYVARVRRASAHVLRLAEDLFDLSRAELGQARVILAPFDAAEPLLHAADLVRLRAERAGLRLDVAAAPGAVPAQGDVDRVRQILVNLLVNAVKFTTADHVSASIERDGERVRFHVTDAGDGVPAELHERIFEPFFQASAPALHRRRDDDGTGAGLGLAVSRSLARAMGGELSVASRAGSGCTFTLTLPVAPAESGAPAVAPAVAPVGVAVRPSRGPERAGLV